MEKKTITSEQIGASNIAQLIGKAAADAKFRKTFLKDPVKAASKFNLDKKQLAALAALDKEKLIAAVEGLKGVPAAGDHSHSHSSTHGSGGDH